MTTTTAPLFGARTAPVQRCDFRLLSYASDGTETEHPFSARAEVDASTALAAMRSQDDARDAAFIEKFLIRVLVDDDGVGRAARPQPVTEDTDDEDGAELVIRSELHSGEWEIDGQVFPSRSLAEQHAVEKGSSLRRFAALMDDPFESVHIDALRQILQYVMEQAGRRPLAPSRRSPQRQTPKRRR
jgi:hypothetical protein